MDDLNEEEEKKKKGLEKQFNAVLQEVVENELFLFSILTGRIEVAKVFWKKGKVRLFQKIMLLLASNRFLYRIQYCWF